MGGELHTRMPCIRNRNKHNKQCIKLLRAWIQRGKLNYHSKTCTDPRTPETLVSACVCMCLWWGELMKEF